MWQVVAKQDVLHSRLCRFAFLTRANRGPGYGPCLAKDFVALASGLALQLFNRRNVVAHVVLLGWRPPSAAFQRRKGRNAGDGRGTRKGRNVREGARHALAGLARCAIQAKRSPGGTRPRRAASAPHTGVGGHESWIIALTIAVQSATKRPRAGDTLAEGNKTSLPH
jgi:hypothetical protein